jgi:hypothetical protein
MLLLPIIRNISIRPMRVYVRMSPGSGLQREKESEGAPEGGGEDKPEVDIALYDIRVRLVRIAGDAVPRAARENREEEDRASGPAPPEPPKNEVSEESVAVAATATATSGGSVVTSYFGSLFRPFYGSQPVDNSKETETETDHTPETATIAISSSASDHSDSTGGNKSGQEESNSPPQPNELQTEAKFHESPSKKPADGAAAADRISQRLANLRRPQP